MFLYPLEANIILDAANMSIKHILIICTFFIMIVLIIFINGFSIKLGNKEINIGGVFRLLARKDEDAYLKESLHNYSEEIDHELYGDLYDLVDSLNYKIEGFTIKEHCYFTFEKFISIVKSELEKRVRRNNLKEKLVKKSREKYVESMLNGIESKYEMLQAKVSILKCGESYADFSAIKEATLKLLYQFFDGANDLLIKASQKKIKKYDEIENKFKTTPAMNFSCVIPKKKNEEYIKNLQGE